MCSYHKIDIYYLLTYITKQEHTVFDIKNSIFDILNSTKTGARLEQDWALGYWVSLPDFCTDCWFASEYQHTSFYLFPELRLPTLNPAKSLRKSCTEISLPTVTDTSAIDTIKCMIHSLNFILNAFLTWKML